MNKVSEQMRLAGLAAGVLALCLLPLVRQHTADLWAQTSPLPTASVTVSPTPSPTKGNIVEIEQPRRGEILFDFADIIGTAAIDGHLKYDLHIAEANSENWIWLTTAVRVVRGAELHTFDTTQFRDGFYDLRLRSIRTDGNFQEDIVRGVEIRNINPPSPTPVINAQGTLEPNSPLPSPTPTPDIRVRIPGGQGFYAPDEGAVLRGLESIVATVNNLGEWIFQRYELAISPAGQEEWSHLISSERQFWQDTIYVLDTTQFPDGRYDLRLRVVYEDANYSEYHLRDLRIDNGSAARGEISAPNVILAPRPGAQVYGVVEFIGTAFDPDFMRWELHWSRSREENWIFLVSDDRPVVNGVLARLDLSRLPAGEYDFRLRVVRNTFNYDEFIVRGIQVVSHFPTSTPVGTTAPHANGAAAKTNNGTVQ